jgi:NAD+ synthase
MPNAERIAGWLRDQAMHAGARGFVFGLSGGIDSALVARLCQLAAPQRVLGVYLPAYSHPQDEDDARLVATTFSIPMARVDLTATFDAMSEALNAGIKGLPHHVDVLDIKQQLPDANVKPRLRMASLYFIANSLNYLVAGTGNRSELLLGYFTKYGDGGVDLLPIGRLLKSEVRALAKQVGVPGRIIDKAPSAGLWMGQTDEEEMGFTYDALEQYLKDGAAAVTPETAQRIERLRKSSEHKRTLPPMPPE